MSRNVVLGLDVLGADVAIVPLMLDYPHARADMFADAKDRLKFMRHKGETDIARRVNVWMSAPENAHKSSTGVLYTTCETSPSSPDIGKRLSKWNHVWVPSAYVRNSLIAGGVPENIITVVPHGVNHKVFCMGRTPARRPRWVPGNPYIFGFSGTVIERKNWGALADTFISAFHGRTDVVLILYVTQCTVSRAEALITEEAGRRAAGTLDGSSVLSWSPLVVIEPIPPGTSDTEYATMVNSIDCWVNVTHGEGFGLVTLEALALGKPIISVDYGGVREFLTPENATLLPVTEVPSRGVKDPAKWCAFDRFKLIDALQREERLGRRKNDTGYADSLRFSYPVICERILGLLEELK